MKKLNTTLDALTDSPHTMYILGGILFVMSVYLGLEVGVGIWH